MPDARFRSSGAMSGCRFASSRARALAVELGVDGASIDGSGRGGAVTVADLRAAATAGPSVPLGIVGRELVAAITAAVAEGCELDEREQLILRLAAGQADDLARLDEVVAREGVAARGSTGQVVVHPAVAEARLARIAIGRLLGSLDLSEEIGSRGTAASRRGRRAAQARWRDRGTRGGEAA